MKSWNAFITQENRHISYCATKRDQPNMKCLSKTIATTTLPMHSFISVYHSNQIAWYHFFRRKCIIIYLYNIIFPEAGTSIYIKIINCHHDIKMLQSKTPSKFNIKYSRPDRPASLELNNIVKYPISIRGMHVWIFKPNKHLYYSWRSWEPYSWTLRKHSLFIPLLVLGLFETKRYIRGRQSLIQCNIIYFLWHC